MCEDKLQYSVTVTQVYNLFAPLLFHPAYTQVYNEYNLDTDIYTLFVLQILIGCQTSYLCGCGSSNQLLISLHSNTIGMLVNGNMLLSSRNTVKK